MLFRNPICFSLFNIGCGLIMCSLLVIMSIYKKISRDCKTSLNYKFIYLLFSCLIQLFIQGNNLETIDLDLNMSGNGVPKEDSGTSKLWLEQCHFYFNKYNVSFIFDFCFYKDISL
jgi:hypothetical protein